jgi:hypothetical protein
LLDKLAQVDDLGLDHLLSAERQKLLRERSRPFSRVLYDPLIFEDGVSVIRVAVHHRAEAEDHLKHVVEIMGDPARQPTDCSRSAGDSM